MARARRPYAARTTESLVSEAERLQTRRALEALNRMLPQLRFFARSITGNPKVEVRVSPEIPHTRGNVISIRPPLGLGRTVPHLRSQCGRRDESGFQSCAACKLREVIEFFLFHEISHVAFDTQAAPDRWDLKLAKEFIEEWHPVGACKHGAILRSILDNDRGRTPDCQNLGGLLVDHIGRIVNCLEDARVNARMFSERPGMETVFRVNLERLMSEGTETGVNQYETWMDAPRDAQFMVGLSVKACGLSVDGRLHPGVVEALSDPRIEAICDRAAQAKDVHEIFKLSMEAFRVAQELEFCVVNKCGDEDEPDPPSLENDPDQPDQGNARELQGSGPSGDGDTEPDRSEQDAGGSESEPAGSPSETDDEPDPNHEGRPSAGDDTEESDGSPDERQESAGGGGDQEEDDSDSTGGDGANGKGSNQFDDDSNGQSSDETRSSDRETLEGEVDGGGLQQESSPAEPDPDSGEVWDDSDRGNEERGGEDDSDEVEVPDESDSSEKREDETSSVVEPENPWDIDAPEETGIDFDGPSAPVAARPIDDLPTGTPDEIDGMLSRFLMHGIDGEQGMLDEIADGDHERVVGSSEHGESVSPEIADLITATIGQMQYFDTASGTVSGVEVIKFPDHKVRWENFHEPTAFMPDEKLIGSAVLRARRVFDDNKRKKTVAHKKSGRINTSVLGRRAPTGDPRLFKKSTRPGKKDYFVVIGADCSGSTSDYGRNEKIKRIVAAQAEILNRVGVQWAGFAHTAYRGPRNKIGRIGSFSDYYLYILPFKEANEPWNTHSRTKLANVVPVSENLDGHTLEFYRKQAEKSTATDKIIIYFTDGEMPMANYDEELEILQREIAICKRRNITLLAVGINTDSPKRYGFDTVKVDSDEDIHLVIDQLDRRLT